MKTTLGAALGVVPVGMMLGRRFRRHLHFVKRSQTWSIDQIRAFQVEQLRRICCLAYDHTAFYRRMFDEAGFDPRRLNDPSDVERLPTINRTTLREHLPEMLATPVWSTGVDFVSTGGTSGEPLQFYIGAARSDVEYAYLVAGWERAGLTLGQPLAVFRGRAVKPDRTGFHHERDPLLRHHYYSTFHMNDENMGRYLAHVATIGPCFLHVYPSSASALAGYMRRSGTRPPPNILGLLAESEIVYPSQRKQIEQEFGRRLFASYGMTEKVVAAAECEHSSDYHVWPTYSYFELLDERGQAISTPGQTGEIVGTGFINTVVPFIRYRTGDFATYVDSRCNACGRAHPRLASIVGHRTQELLVANDGSRISWTAVNMHDDTFDRVGRFQFRQDVAGHATLRLVAAPGFGPDDEARILRRLDHKLGGRITVTIDRVAAIGTTPSGKSIYVDQRIPDDGNHPAPTEASTIAELADPTF